MNEPDEAQYGGLLDAIDAHTKRGGRMVFWTCLNGCRDIVDWKHEGGKSVATCRKCGATNESCVEPCVLGDMGHCGRTARERRSHCEKRFYAGLPQLSNIPRKTDTVTPRIHTDAGHGG
jgi:hypothetical protein